VTEREAYRPGGVTYLRIPAQDVAVSAAFYEAVFGWTVDAEQGRFADGPGDTIGHWQTDLPPAGHAGVVPYVYVASLDDALATAQDLGAEIVTPPYPEGDLTVALLRDPAGNVVGAWQRTG
jgi:predicted enzyme related to lactoylglutathione lyase